MALTLIDAPSLGAGWLRVARVVLEEGMTASWGGLATREVALLSLVVERPASNDAVIAELGDPDWLEWMHENFFVQGGVAELGRTELRGAALRLRKQRTRPARLGGEPARGRSGLPRRDDHDVRAPHRRELRPLCEHARLLAPPRGGGRARRVRAQPRLRQEGVRKPRRARPPSGARRRQPGRPGRGGS